jgi:hypothetical protein
MLTSKTVRFYTLEVKLLDGTKYNIKQRWSEILKFIAGLENKLKQSKENKNGNEKEREFRISYYSKMVKVYTDPRGYVSDIIKDKGGYGRDNNRRVVKREELINNYFEIMSGKHNGRTFEFLSFSTDDEKMNLLDKATYFACIDGRPFIGQLFGDFFKI